MSSLSKYPTTDAQVVWAGINDVSGIDATLVEDAMENLDNILTQCHKLGFRNLLLIDVPPRKLFAPEKKGRCLFARQKSWADQSVPVIYDVIKDNIESWNAALKGQLSSWTARRGTKGNIFSSYQLFKDILKTPATSGFARSDPYTERGGIWIDHIHPTTEVHRLLFEGIKSFLS